MLDCLVVAAPVDQGIYQEFRGMRYGIRGLMNLGNYDEDEGNIPMRTLKVWSCAEVDVEPTVKALSDSWVGHEIRVYKLTQISTRLPGELKTKEISKDGVLPV